jgi:hypothetical protein
VKHDLSLSPTTEIAVGRKGTTIWVYAKHQYTALTAEQAIAMADAIAAEAQAIVDAVPRESAGAS